MPTLWVVNNRMPPFVTTGGGGSDDGGGDEGGDEGGSDGSGDGIASGGGEGGAGGDGWSVIVESSKSFMPHHGSPDHQPLDVTDEVTRTVAVPLKCVTTTSARAGISLLMEWPPVPHALVDPLSM